MSSTYMNETWIEPLKGQVPALLEHSQINLEDRLNWWHLCLQVKTAMDLLMPSRGADEAEKYLKKKIKAHNEDNEAGYYARVALAEVLMHRVFDYHS